MVGKWLERESAATVPGPAERLNSAVRSALAGFDGGAAWGGGEGLGAGGRAAWVGYGREGTR